MVIAQALEAFGTIMLKLRHNIITIITITITIMEMYIIITITMQDITTLVEEISVEVEASVVNEENGTAFTLLQNSKKRNIIALAL